MSRKIAAPPYEGESLRAYADRLGWGHSPPPPPGTEIMLGAVYHPVRREPRLTRDEGRALGLPEPEVDSPIAGLWPPDALAPLSFLDRPAWWPPAPDPTAHYSKRRNLRGRRTKADPDDLS